MKAYNITRLHPEIKWHRWTHLKLIGKWKKRSPHTLKHKK